MDNTQGWCAACGAARDFVPVPDAEQDEYVCVACAAAVVVAGSDRHAAVA